jgi:hypothetical protein
MRGHQTETLVTVKKRLRLTVRRGQSGESVPLTKRRKKVAALVPFETFEGPDRGDRILEVLERYAPRGKKRRRENV